MTDPILSAASVSKSFGSKSVLKDVDLVLYPNEIVSLLGVSGAGKTTLFNILSGVMTPDDGRVLLENNDVTGKPGKISYMLQKDLLFPYKRIIDNVIIPMVIRGEKKSVAREKAAPYFKTFGLEGTQMQYPSQLSGGMRQRAALLRTYLSANGVALLDEPFSALDPITKSDMHRWYLDVMQQIDLSTLFITHDIDEAILLSDRIYVLTGRPATIRHMIKVEEPKPRRRDFSLSSEFLDYKRKIVEILHLT